MTQPVKGTFTETFRATDANGVTASGSSTVTIAPQPLIITVDCGSGQTADKAFSCTVSATGGTTPYTGTGTVSRTEATKGTKTESFTVTDANGSSASGSAHVTISPQPVTVIVACPSSGLTAGEPFTCIVSAAGGTAPYTGTGSQSVTQQAKGTHTEMFSVTDANHVTASGSAIVTVVPRSLSVDFTVLSVSSISGQSVGFSASGTGGTGPYSFSWDFGDNSPSASGSSVQHTYAVTTTTSFSVVVTGRDANGVTATASHMITVSSRLTASRLTCSPNPVNVDQASTCTFAITDTSNTPTGIVSFSTSSLGSFSPSASCSLAQESGPPGTSSCQVTYTPSDVGSGLHTISARYSGDTVHAASTLTTGLTVSAVHAEVKCGEDDTCTVRSNATITNADADRNKLRLTAMGAKGTVGWANVTLPRTSVPNINKLQVRVDGIKIPRTSIIVTTDGTSYYVFFTFTFHSPANIEVEFSPRDTILGLDPTIFYGSLTGLVTATIAGVTLFVLRRRSRMRSQASLVTTRPARN